MLVDLTAALTELARPHVGHGCRKVDGAGVVRSDANLDRTRPLVDEPIDADLQASHSSHCNIRHKMSHWPHSHLKHLLVLDWSVRHDDTVVELVERPLAFGRAASVAQLDERAGLLVEDESLARLLEGALLDHLVDRLVVYDCNTRKDGMRRKNNAEETHLYLG